MMDSSLKISIRKYPRTPHLPFSPGISKDDIRLKDMSNFYGKNISITEKMDGENISIYKNYWHCRSIDSAHKEYHSYLQNKIIPKLQSSMGSNYKIVGEYLYAKHSIYYDNLPDFFEVFMIAMYNYELKEEVVLGQSLTRYLCNKFNVEHVPFLGYIPNFRPENEIYIKRLAEQVVKRGGEGIVIRNNDWFSLKDFDKNIAKYVRKDHVQTDEHWSKHIFLNKLFNH